jgi:hypothetical protein
MLLRAILGIEYDAERRLLRVNPTLPDWLDDVTIRGLHCAGGTADVRFTGRGLDSRAHVLRTTGGVSVEQISD